MNTCPICLDEITVIKYLPCAHAFCESCIDTWFKEHENCPICRKGNSFDEASSVSEDEEWFLNRNLSDDYSTPIDMLEQLYTRRTFIYILHEFINTINERYPLTINRRAWESADGEKVGIIKQLIHHDIPIRTFRSPTHDILPNEHIRPISQIQSRAIRFTTYDTLLGASSAPVDHNLCRENRLLAIDFKQLTLAGSPVSKRQRERSYSNYQINQSPVNKNKRKQGKNKNFKRL